MANTKRALLTSALAIVACVAMLIGSTFAWFTDTASTGVNKIQAGNLDVKLEYKNTKGADFKEAKADTPVFKDGALWEPGHVEYVVLKVSNAGNLALKYKLGINIASEKESTNVYGNTFKLSDYIRFAVLNGDKTEGDINRDALVGEAGEGAALNEGYTADGQLSKKGDANIVTLVVWMPTTVGNEANHKTDADAPEIDLGITVVATQDTVESDSFGPEYDAKATYPVMNSTGLSNALNEAEEGSTVVVASGEYELPSTGIPAGVSVSGAGMGKTNLTAPATKSGNQKTGLVVDKPGVTVSNATITGHADITSDMYCGLLDIRKDGTVLDGVEIVNRTSLASGVVIKSGVGVGETVTMKNSKLNVYYRAFYIVDGANGTIEIDNCDITGSVYALNVNSANSQDLVIKCTNSKLHGWSSYGDIKSASFENVEFSKGASEYDYLRPYADTTLKNCTFDNGFMMGAGKTGFTITIEDCTYNGTVLTAANVCDLMFDTDDLDNLKGCTITVNGVNVVL